MHNHDHEGGLHDQGVKMCDSTDGIKPVASYKREELVLDDEIIAKAQELADLISTSEEVQFFKQADAKLKQHEQVQTLIKTIKRKQKEAVAFEHFKNPQKVKQIEAEIDELQTELDAVPLVQQFQQVQSDLNDMLQLVMNVMASRVSEQIQVQLGAESVLPPSNCSDEA